MKSYDCCLGMARFLHDPKQDECTFVTELRHLGAIPFGYTNVPQNLLNVTCSNPVFGFTTNPQKVRLNVENVYSNRPEEMHIYLKILATDNFFTLFKYKKVRTFIFLNIFLYKKNSGASSGGESCLLAAGGTPFGIGYDLSGSLRLPAFFCSLVTLKPCQGQ